MLDSFLNHSSTILPDPLASHDLDHDHGTAHSSSSITSLTIPLPLLRTRRPRSRLASSSRDASPDDIRSSAFDELLRGLLWEGRLPLPRSTRPVADEEEEDEEMDAVEGEEAVDDVGSQEEEEGPARLNPRTKGINRRQTSKADKAVSDDDDDDDDDSDNEASAKEPPMEILRAKAFLRTVDGSAWILQGVRDVYEFTQLPHTVSISENPTMTSGVEEEGMQLAKEEMKLVVIGRGLHDSLIAQFLRALGMTEDADEVEAELVMDLENVE